MTFNCLPFLEICKASCCTKRIFDKRLWKVNSHFSEYVVKVDYINNKACITTTDNMCPFLCRKQHRCKIYDSRPQICKKMGECKELPCSYQGRLGHPRSIARRIKFLRQQKKKIKEMKEEIHKKALNTSTPIQNNRR